MKEKDPLDEEKHSQDNLGNPEEGLDQGPSNPDSNPLEPGQNGSLDPDAFLESNPDIMELIRRLIRDDGESPAGPANAGSAEARTSMGMLPRHIGDFLVLRKLGEGATSEVFEAEQISLKRRVALKILPRTVSLSEKAVKRFLREGEAIARLDHPGIVKVITPISDIEDGVYAIAQELVEGGRTLADAFKQRPTKGPNVLKYFQEIAEKIMRVAEALQHAHERGVIHRDVKPSNILITQQGTPKVADFGIARIEGMASTQSTDHSGTIFYISPEQATEACEKVDYRTDIFSLGATLYEALTLKRPFPGESSEEVLKRLMECRPEDMRKLDRRIPRELRAICSRAMEKEPSKRYPSMAEFAKDLRRYLSGEPLSRGTMGWLPRTRRWVRRRKGILAGAAIIMLAAVGSAILGVHSASRNFLPAKDSFSWLTSEQAFHSFEWAATIDPNDLSWPLCQIIRNLEVNTPIGESGLQKNEAELRSLIHKCEQRRVDLLDDARYLLAYILRKRADGATLEQQQTLIAESEETLGEIGFFNPFSAKTLFWRGDLDSASKNGLRVNSGHYLAQLYTGITLSNSLYKGGSRLNFTTCIRHLEAALGMRPQDRIALASLGRVYFFFSRTFWDFTRLSMAEEILNRALVDDGADPSGMTNTTIGQIRCLYGDYLAAKSYLEKALAAGKDRFVYKYNVLCNLGRVNLRLGDAEAALSCLVQAEKANENDVYVQLALSELFFLQGDIPQAETYAEKAKQSGIASSYLALCRCAARRGDTAELIKQLTPMTTPGLVIHCPRDFYIACILLSSICTEEGSASWEKILNLAEQLLNIGSLDASDTPLHQTALGAVYYLGGSYALASKSLESCLAQGQRRKEEILPSSRMQEASSLYLLAMASFKAPGLEDQAFNAFEEAEIIAKAPPGEFVEYWDILEGVRQRAKAVLGVEK